MIKQSIFYNKKSVVLTLLLLILSSLIGISATWISFLPQHEHQLNDISVDVTGPTIVHKYVTDTTSVTSVSISAINVPAGDSVYALLGAKGSEGFVSSMYDGIGGDVMHNTTVCNYNADTESTTIWHVDNSAGSSSTTLTVNLSSAHDTDYTTLVVVILSGTSSTHSFGAAQCVDAPAGSSVSITTGNASSMLFGIWFGSSGGSWDSPSLEVENEAPDDGGGYATDVGNRSTTSATSYSMAYSLSGAGSLLDVIEVDPASPPSAPTSLAASGMTSTTVPLTWTNPSGTLVNNTVYYKVGSTCASSGMTAISIGSAATSYTITGLTTKTEYAIEVTAWNSVGQSPDSSCLIAYTIGVPTTPTSLTVGSITYYTIPLTWTNPSGGGLVNNTVYYKTGASCASSGMTAVSIGSAVTSYTITGLSLGTQYSIETTAWNSTGQSPDSNCVQATTSSSVPAAPASLVVTTKTTTHLSLTWSNSGVVGGLNNTVYYKAGNACTATGMTAISMSGVTTSYTITGLTTGVQYAIEVTVWNSTGQSADSNCYLNDTATVPAAPSGLTFVSATTTSISVSWTNPSGGGLVNNTVYFKIGNSCGAETNAINMAGIGTSTDITGLMTGDTYAIEVASWNATGESGFSNCLIATASAIPSAPTSLMVTATTTTTISLSWTNPGGGGLVNNTVYYIAGSACAASGMTAINIGSVVTSKQITSLVTATQYALEVTAWNSSGQSPDSNCVITTTAQDPAAPTGLSAMDITETTITWMWTNPSGGGLTSNSLYWYSNDTCSGQPVSEYISGSAITSHDVTGLLVDQEYSALVYASNNTGTGPASSCATGTTLSAVSTSFTSEYNPTDVGVGSVFTGSCSGGEETFTIEWFINGAMVEDYSNNNTCASVYTVGPNGFTSAGSYLVAENVTDINGFYDNFTLDEIVHSNPTATASPTTATNNTTVEFISSVSGGTSGFTYQWGIGGLGTVGTGADLNYTFTTVGNYTVFLNVTDSLGQVYHYTFTVNNTAPVQGFVLTLDDEIYIIVGVLAVILIVLLVLVSRRGRRRHYTRR
jgi:hypothetical protein